MYGQKLFEEIGRYMRWIKNDCEKDPQEIARRTCEAFNLWRSDTSGERTDEIPDYLITRAKAECGEFDDM